MRILTLIALSAMSIAVAAPALAQGAMKPEKMTKMSDADAKNIKMCQAMPHDKMTKNAECMKMMKKHPDMMKGNAMEKDNKMMPRQ